MGKTKQFLEELEMRDDYDYQYKKWLESDEFVEYVNREIDKTRPQYSEQDIMDATRYASTHITLDPNEIGKQVYDMLFSEKIEEYLSLYVIR